MPVDWCRPQRRRVAGRRRDAPLSVLVCGFCCLWVVSASEPRRAAQHEEAARRRTNEGSFALAEISEATGYGPLDAYPLTNLYDGDYETIGVLGGSRGLSGGAWVSLYLGSTTGVAQVAVYDQDNSYGSLLGSFEVWVDDSPGSGTVAYDPATATQCGGLVQTTAALGPFIADCGDSVSADTKTTAVDGLAYGSWVTIKQVTSGNGWLAVVEVEVLRAIDVAPAPNAPPSPPPSLLPSPNPNPVR